ncbi:type II restriction endonuclease [Helicobacter trogontum]|uniref:Type II restriction endonuclease n=2 Tax=Helicobacter trogontum TaxID=50960 RepID=A0A4V6HZL6_9HELI|nr:type II restriction endonuclease [Helicobacter trogontum]
MKIIKPLDQILESKIKDFFKELESKIDNLVYTLYNLNEDEIKIIEVNSELY